MRPSLRAIFVFVLISASAFVSNSAFARKALSDSVINGDPYLMTLSAALLTTPTTPVPYSLDSIPGRDQLPIFGGQAAVQALFFKGPSPRAPLLFVVPGLGGSASNGASRYLADLLAHAGYNVAVVPNPFSWRFVLKRSPDAVAGYIPEEVQQLAEMMAEVRVLLSRDGVQPTSVSAVGYSLGAIDLGFLEIAEKRGLLRKPMGFSHVVMINPPLDLAYALDRLDSLERVRDQLTQTQRDLTWNTAYNQEADAELPTAASAVPSFFEKTLKELKITPTEAAFLIGETFRQTLGDVIVVSQEVQDRGFLKQPIDKSHRSAREAEAAGFLYGDYMHSFMIPFWQRKYGTEFNQGDFIAQASLIRFVGELKAIPAIHLIHNVDDFLTRSADLAILDSALGTRSIVFPHGGHVGNLWEPSVQQALISALRE